MHKLSAILLFAFLASCNNTNSSTKETTEATQETTTTQESPTLGVYHAYQLSGAGYGFQYKFELVNDHQYKMFDKTGEYTYEPATKIIRFTSGGIKDFAGIFTRINHVNDTRKLMIVLDINGAVPDTLALGKKPGGYYQYAYYQGEK